MIRFESLVQIFLLKKWLCSGAFCKTLRIIVSVDSF